MTSMGILENLVADLIFIAIGLIIGWIVLRNRNKLLRFFGISKTRRIILYISNLRVLRFGAIGINNERYNYQGSVAGFLEIQAAMRFREVFNYILPSITDKPSLLAKLFIADVLVEIRHSPLQKTEIDQVSPLISLGSPAYNIVAKYIEQDLQSQVEFQYGIEPLRQKSSNPSIKNTTDSSTGYSGGTITPVSAVEDFQRDQSEDKRYAAIKVQDLEPFTDGRYGFVQRLIDTRHNNRTVFYVAGISEKATVCATYFLLTQWKDLHRKYGNRKPFLILLRTEEDVTKWTIILERE